MLYHEYDSLRIKEMFNYNESVKVKNRVISSKLLMDLKQRITFNIHKIRNGAELDEATKKSNKKQL